MLENANIEFMPSLFIGEEGEKPQERFAKSVAGMINSTGGEIRVGVSANGEDVAGIKNDVALLFEGGDAVATNGAYGSDAGYAYRKDVDSYCAKIHKIIEVFLGENASRYVSIQRRVECGNLYLIVAVAAARDGGFVRFARFGIRETEIYIRDLGVTRLLVGDDRDAFMQNKAREEFLSAKNIIPFLEMRLNKQGTTLKEYIGEKLQEKVSEGGGDIAPGTVMPDWQKVMAGLRRKLGKSEKTLSDSQLEFTCYTDMVASASKILKEFERVEGGKKKYVQLVIGNTKDPFFSLPYLECKGSDWRYERISDVDFELDNIRWLLRRADITPFEQKILNKRRASASFSWLITRGTRSIEDYLWGAMLDELKDARAGEDVELMFKDQFPLFRRGTKVRPATCYRICGIRFTKGKLRTCPSSIDRNCEHRERYELLHFM